MVKSAKEIVTFKSQLYLFWDSVTFMTLYQHRIKKKEKEANDEQQHLGPAGPASTISG